MSLLNGCVCVHVCVRNKIPILQYVLLRANFFPEYPFPIVALFWWVELAQQTIFETKHLQIEDSGKMTIIFSGNKIILLECRKKKANKIYLSHLLDTCFIFLPSNYSPTTRSWKYRKNLFYTIIISFLLPNQFLIRFLVILVWASFRLTSSDPTTYSPFTGYWSGTAFGDPSWRWHICLHGRPCLQHPSWVANVPAVGWPRYRSVLLWDFVLFRFPRFIIRADISMNLGWGLPRVGWFRLCLRLCAQRDSCKLSFFLFPPFFFFSRVFCNP